MSGVVAKVKSWDSRITQTSVQILTLYVKVHDLEQVSKARNSPDPSGTVARMG